MVNVNREENRHNETRFTGDTLTELLAGWATAELRPVDLMSGWFALGWYQRLVAERLAELGYEQRRRGDEVRWVWPRPTLEPQEAEAVRVWP